MENNKICPNCQTHNDNNSKFCVNCGQQLVLNNDIVNNQSNSINNSEGNMWGIISLLLYFAGTTIVSLITFILPDEVKDSFSSLIGMSPLAGIVIMIIGRVKYPKNKLLKIAMWLIIGSIFLSLVAFVLFVIWCYVTCANFDKSGCY